MLLNWTQIVKILNRTHHIDKNDIHTLMEFDLKNKVSIKIDYRLVIFLFCIFYFGKDLISFSIFITSIAHLLSISS